MFEPKVLVWNAISRASISEIFLIESCDSMSKTRYIEVLVLFVTLLFYFSYF